MSPDLLTVKKTKVEDELREHKNSNLQFPQPLIYLIGGGLLLLIYFFLASELGFFVDSDVSYISLEIGRVPWGVLDMSYMRYFPSRFASSVIWKLVLLFPGTCLLALFLTLKGTRIFLGSASRIRSLQIYFAVSALLIIVIFANSVFKQTAVTDDERTYDLQARILLEGKLFTSPPPVPESFDTFFVITDGKYTGKYTIGHPLLLAAGMLLGSSYLLPILLSASLILLVYGISKRLYGNREVSLLTAFLLLISPFFVFTSSTRLSHSTTAFFLGIFMLLFLETFSEDRKHGVSLLFSFLAGFCVGYAFNVRPLTAVGFSIPFVILLMAKLVKEKWNVLPQAFLMFMGFFLVLLFTLWCNKQVTGSWTEFPFHHYNPTERMGFGHVLKNSKYMHTPARALVNLAVSGLKMNIFLFGVPISLLFIAPFLFLHNMQKGDKLCLGIIAAFCFSYLFYYSPGVSDTGPIYYYELVIPLVILSARGVFLIHGFLARRFPEIKHFVGNFIFLSFLLTALTFYPERILHILNLTEKISEPYEAVEKNDIHNAVVFIRSVPLSGWVFGFKLNSPGFDDDVLYCRLLSGEKNLEVTRNFPERDYYIMWYDSEKGVTRLIEVTEKELGQIKEQ